ncbi:hypothetical protein GW17_00014827 [Ensete ventricosum]|nr:hypothetical protein GW17_00014827 [Ensete ventricosum]
MEPRRHHSKNGLSYSNLFNLELIRRRRRHGVESEAVANSSLRNDTDSNDEVDEEYENGISEEHYRAMLSDHVQKYRKVKSKESLSGLASSRIAMSGTKRSHGSKTRKFTGEPLVSAKGGTTSRKMEISPGYYEADLDVDYDGNNRYTLSMDSTYLDIGEGITYQIPPSYDKLMSSLNLPSIADIIVEENFLNGSLDLRSLAAMIATDRRFDMLNQGGLNEPQPQYESLQARLKAFSFGNSDKKFTLQVCDIGLDPFSIPEGAAGRIRRLIMSDSGTLQVYYVKVLEKGDTYEVKLKVSRSLRLMRSAAVRTRRLARDMLIFWKKVDKEQAELRKKEERDAAEALKREEELREAKRQQQRLNFLISQTELYSHFMGNKSSAQPAENLLVVEGEAKLPEEESLPLDSKSEDEEDPEEVELKKEAHRAAKQAVSQQKKITNEFDNACLRLRQVAETKDQANDSAGGSNDIDLLNP